MTAAGEVGWRSGCLAGGWAAVPGRDQGDLAAEQGQGVLVVADQVLAVGAGRAGRSGPRRRRRSPGRGP